MRGAASTMATGGAATSCSTSSRTPTGASDVRRAVVGILDELGVDHPRRATPGASSPRRSTEPHLRSRPSACSREEARGALGLLHKEQVAHALEQLEPRTGISDAMIELAVLTPAFGPRHRGPPASAP